MIPIGFDTSIVGVQDALDEYDTYLKHFEKQIDRVINNKTIGRGVGKLSLNEDEVKIFKILKKRLGVIANMKPKLMPQFIRFMQSGLGVQKGNHIFECISRFCVANGYDGGAFPKDAIMKGTDLIVCPYCNREYVGNVDVFKIVGGNIVRRNIKGQLDHFYHKALYPYLAISRYNLVPSCHTCNEVPNKHDDDVMQTSLVSPYSLIDNNQISFKLKLNIDPLSRAEKDDDIEIVVEYKPNMKPNMNTFSILNIYNGYHRKEAKRVYNLFKQTYPDSYKGGIDQLTTTLKKKTDFAFFKKEDCNVVADANEYRHIILSKMCTEIWNGLETGNIEFKTV